VEPEIALKGTPGLLGALSDVSYNLERSKVATFRTTLYTWVHVPRIL